MWDKITLSGRKLLLAPRDETARLAKSSDATVQRNSFR
jgi:hypothetical protein